MTSESDTLITLYFVLSSTELSHWFISCPPAKKQNRPGLWIQLSCGLRGSNSPDSERSRWLGSPEESFSLRLSWTSWLLPYTIDASIKEVAVFICCLGPATTNNNNSNKRWHHHHCRRHVIVINDNSSSRCIVIVPVFFGFAVYRRREIQEIRGWGLAIMARLSNILA